MQVEDVGCAGLEEVVDARWWCVGWGVDGVCGMKIKVGGGDRVCGRREEMVGIGVMVGVRVEEMVM